MRKEFKRGGSQSLCIDWLRGRGRVERNCIEGGVLKGGRHS